ncbi:glycoside hydrolase 43 family protein [Klebsiella quasipneumoniae]|uniref:glycoside hydrolase family 43 protein n=1 Tax=Klebsiella quasipneumoniae TaxID=1463165 RepID=UPI0008E09FB9|nr:glycoside hydrolase 43 family protein [Klebsiella quasipneumoniae]MCJ9551843.1 glycoside hydrolase 43 family protein [Klebsiella quasipneumoniae]MCS5750701.1 glycoside hydrolase 43 family protein [Klebsiella quasipneumoniae subsp. quasipneumoniae]MDI3218757.1 family 43 glycosylhydrolase [Klebsiella quasipneumoniae]MDZ3016613.1 glycoside hydrolase 43 family protein [Klebsiella quasipneumoniae]UAA14481.1 glycoside hydrolase 43 family protein [Klebsiella quasipneumoniae]
MPLFYQNPVIHADYADPDVIRTGDDFWMVASSFHQLPGLPLLHSRDLIHWQIVNHIIKRLPSPEYDSVQPGKGIWAPSIRFHGGLFWVFYSLPDEGIFVSHARDPLGEWSEPYCLNASPGWIDPCPFWDDDGRAWLIHAFAFSRSGVKNKLQIFEMAADASRLLDNGRLVVDGTPSHPTLEGPKLYKRNGEYWIFAPAGGVKRGWQTVMRAPTLSGPWQSRDVLHQGDSPINGPHQGAWVELENGENWFFHFQDKGVYGRIVHLQPLSWRADGWPQIGQRLDDHGKGQPVSLHRLPALPLAPCCLQTSDDFPSGQPGLQWQWQANPQRRWLMPHAQGLRLRCAPTASDISLYRLPQLLLQKFPAERFHVQTAVHPMFSQDGDEAGVAIYGQRFAALRVRYCAPTLQLSLCHGWIDDCGETHQESIELEAIAGCNEIALGFQVDYDGIVRFCYRLTQREWQQVTPSFSAGAGKWIGARMGIYARGAHENAGSSAVFSPFIVRLQ